MRAESLPSGAKWTLTTSPPAIARRAAAAILPRAINRSLSPSPSRVSCGYRREGPSPASRSQAHRWRSGLACRAGQRRMRQRAGAAARDIVESDTAGDRHVFRACAAPVPAQGRFDPFSDRKLVADTAEADQAALGVAAYLLRRQAVWRHPLSRAVGIEVGLVDADLIAVGVADDRHHCRQGRDTPPSVPVVEVEDELKVSRQAPGRDCAAASGKVGLRVGAGDQSPRLTTASKVLSCHALFARASDAVGGLSGSPRWLRSRGDGGPSLRAGSLPVTSRSASSLS